MTSRFCYLLAFAGACIFGDVVLAQSPPTIWHALGIPQACKHIHATTFNRKGNHPKFEKKPPLKALADPANLKSDVPAIKKAAEIKAQEDLAPQKIKALKYLANIGCGCYGGVAEALTAALEDCTEEVRYQASLAIVQALSSNCQVCQKTCCTKELAAKMYERVYGQDADGCFLEPSDRVRGVLMRALDDCPPDMRDVGPVDDLIDPLLDPGGGTPSLRDAPPAAPLPQPPEAEALFPAPAAEGNPAASSRRGESQHSLLHNTSAGSITYEVAAEQAPLFEPAPAAPTVPQPITGEVIEGKTARGFVRILFDHKWLPPVGTELDVFHHYVLGTEFTGRLVIVEYEGNYAIAGPQPWDSVKVARGDHVHCTVMVPAPVPPTFSDIAQSNPLPEHPARAIAARTASTAVTRPLPLPAPPAPVETQPASQTRLVAESRPAVQIQPAVEKRLDVPLLDILQPPPVVVEPLDEEEPEPSVVPAAVEDELPPVDAAQPAPVEEEHLAPIVLPPKVVTRR